MRGRYSLGLEGVSQGPKPGAKMLMRKSLDSQDLGNAVKAPTIQLSGDIYSKCKAGEEWRSKHCKSKLCNMPDRAKVRLPFGLKIEAPVQRKLVSTAWGRVSLPLLPGGCGWQVRGDTQ